jgi:hypothetical protein
LGRVPQGREDAEEGRAAGVWKRKSVFWELPYWEYLETRHCIDVMHIEKNVFESLLGLLFNMATKTKYGVESRSEMETIGIRDGL